MPTVLLGFLLPWTWGISYLGCGVSLTLDVGYLFMAAPEKRSHCSLPWMRSPLLILNVELLLSALLRLRSHRSLDVGLFLSAAAPDLGHAVAQF